MLFYLQIFLLFNSLFSGSLNDSRLLFVVLAFGITAQPLLYKDMNKDWKKYNGALITNLPPHEKNDIGKIKMFVKSNVYFARWVTNFDCLEEMPFGI